jgi:sugar phosphate isomerase/epimerase
MRLGIGSYAFSWAIGIPNNIPEFPLTPLGLIDKAIELEVKCIQFVDNVPLHQYSENEISLIANKADIEGIGIEVGTRGLLPENLDRYLEIAEVFRSPILRIVIDASGYHPDEDTVIGILKDYVHILESKNITLAIENHDRIKAKSFVRILDKISSSHVGICLDSINSIGAGECFETVFNLLGPYTVNYHVKDYRIHRVYHMMGYIVEGTPAGTGLLPIRETLEKLKTWGRCRSAILETWVAPEDNMRFTIEKEQNWAKESVRYLRSLIKD